MTSPCILLSQLCAHSYIATANPHNPHINTCNKTNRLCKHAAQTNTEESQFKGFKLIQQDNEQQQCRQWPGHPAT